MKKKAGTAKRLTAIAVMLLLCVLATVYILNLAHSRMEEARQAEIEREMAEAEQQAAEEAAQAESERAEKAASIPQRVYSLRGSSEDEAYTMASYEHAIEAGSGFITMPYVVSLDGTAYVAGDDEAHELTGYAGSFSGMTDGQIAELTTRGGANIVKLSDVIDKYGKEANYIFEIQYTGARNIEALSEIIGKYDIGDNSAISSEHFSILRSAEAELPDIPKIFLCRDDVTFGEALGLECVDAISVSKDLMVSEYCKMAHDYNKKFGAFALNSDQDIKAAIEMGVDSYFTDETVRAIEIEKSY